MRAVNEKFVDLGTPRRIWAVAAIHGEKERLVALHDHLAMRFKARDRLVYLGNFIGAGSRDNAAVFDELLSFRAALMAQPGMEPGDIAHLRGPAEEAWQRLLRLQFAPVPAQALERLMAAGVESYLRLYGISLNDAKTIARAGSVAITRWINHLRAAQRQIPGHEPVMCGMRRAAVTRTLEKGGARLLFVPAGFDAGRSLEDQGDHLWYGTAAFPVSCSQSAQYARIVRGFDAGRGGIDTEGVAVTLDGGCGYGGPLVCGCFNAAGKLLEIIAVGGKVAVENLPLESRPPLSDVAPPRLTAATTAHWASQIAASA
jgi:hypothetical protein